MKNNIITADTLSNMKVCGSTPHIVFPKTTQEIVAAYKEAREKGLRVFPLGGGSNTLIGNAKKTMIISDRDMPEVLEIDERANNNLPLHSLIIASSNQNINTMIYTLARQGYGGLDFLAGIPAHLGGLVYMNAGAYGKSISQYVVEVEVCDENGLRTMQNEECNGDFQSPQCSGDFQSPQSSGDFQSPQSSGDFQSPPEYLHFEYRKSNITGFITKVCLRLRKISDNPVGAKYYLPTQSDIDRYILQINDAIALRAEKHPMDMPNLGCFFKNPKTIDNEQLSNKGFSAGALIEQAGLKGTKIGGAMVSEKHSNFIINTGNATFDDIIQLKELVKEKVYKKYNIKLEEEVRIIND